MAKPKSMGKKILFWAIGVIAGIIFMITVAGAIFTWQAKRLRDTYTDTTAQQFPKVELKKTERRKLETNFKSFIVSAQKGRKGTFRFSEQDLNALLWAIPDARQAQGKMSFKMVDNQLHLLFTVPLDKLKIPGMKGRHLNGDFVLETDFSGTTPVIKVGEARAKGLPLPEKLLEMGRVRELNLANEMMKNRDWNARLKRIKKIEIEANDLVIQLEGR